MAVRETGCGRSRGRLQICVRCLSRSSGNVIGIRQHRDLEHADWAEAVPVITA